ncbi:MAG: phosphoglycerate kinase [Patescibacteria group bacterium]
MEYKTLKDIGDIKGKRILVRFDFNVPVQNGAVVDDFRIRKAIPTLDFLVKGGARIGIIAHIEGESDSLKPVYEVLKKTHPVEFCEDCVEEGKDKLAALPEGRIILFENLRLYDGEKKNDPDFVEKLASIGELYVNDAFSVSHRKHASVVGVPAFLPGYLGFQFEEEVENLTKCFNPPHPFLFILGGAKFDTKLPLVEKFLPIADTIFIGGALANDLFKAKGFNVGTSLVSKSDINLSGYAVDQKIMLPADVVAVSETGTAEKQPNELSDNEAMLDVGEMTLVQLQEKIKAAKCILWNGPLGNYEKGYKEPTLRLARMISESDALTVVGGGDTLAAIMDLKIEDKFSFVSTGGGAMLDFLGAGTLPGLQALK